MHFDIYDYFLLDRSRNEILISFSRNRGEGKGKEGGRTIFKKKCRRNRALEMLIELSLLLMSILEDGGELLCPRAIWRGLSCENERFGCLELAGNSLGSSQR